MRVPFFPLALVALSGVASAADFEFAHENVLGTSLELQISAPSKEAASHAERAVLAEIDRIAAIVSSYDDHSEFSRWVKTKDSAETVSPELKDVFEAFDRWQRRTEGALNAGAGAVVELWKNAAAKQVVPSEEEKSQASRLARRRHWNIEGETVAHTSDAPLTLDALAKGFIIDRAVDAALAVDGVSGVMMNIGGDLAVRGNVVERVAVADPRHDAENAAPLTTVTLRDQAMATSGVYRRGFEIAGEKFSHIVDPRTGRPVDDVVSATVVAPAATDADALATALSVMGTEKGLALVNGFPGIECLLVDENGRQTSSAGWDALVAANPETLRTQKNEDEPRAGYWRPDWELAVNFELATIEGKRVRRPFVAVWIEDEQRQPIRTIALWFNRDRWLPDLKHWFRADNARPDAASRNLKTTISSATRGPGAYTVVWDGRDNAGKLVKTGTYTVNLEVVREHGTHQIIRRKVDFDETARQIPLEANEEVSAASLDYRKRPD